MPAYNAAKTLRQDVRRGARSGTRGYHHPLVDDRSRDETVEVAKSLEGVQVHVHEVNKGYGRESKDLLPPLALSAGADIVVMIHPTIANTRRSCCRPWFP